MKRLESISTQNFQESFNLDQLLPNSIFYPASGIDATGIELLNYLTDSFVHIDYGVPLQEVKKAMRTEFNGIGYVLVGMKDLSSEELLGSTLLKQPSNLNQFEMKKLKDIEVAKLLDEASKEIAAVWAVYELSESTPATDKKQKRFSLLHIKGEACAVLEALYCSRGVNPMAIVIINPGDGFGNNWTMLSNSEFRFYRLLTENALIHGISMPEWLLSNYLLPKGTDQTYWPQYKFSKTMRNSAILAQNIRLYKYEY